MQGHTYKPMPTTKSRNLLRVTQRLLLGKETWQAYHEIYGLLKVAIGYQLGLSWVRYGEADCGDYCHYMLFDRI